MLFFLNPRLVLFLKIDPYLNLILWNHFEEVISYFSKKILFHDEKLSFYKKSHKIQFFVKKNTIINNLRSMLKEFKFLIHQEKLLRMCKISKITF